MTFSKRVQDLQNLRYCRVGDALAKLMLRTLDDRIGEGKGWEMTFADLADEMEVSTDVAYRKAHMLRDLGLIDFTLTNHAAARYRFVIARSNLPDFIPAPSGPNRLRRRGRPPGSSRRAGRQKTTAISENISLTAKTFRSERKPSAHSETLFLSAPLAPTTAPSARDRWAEAEERLISYGVSSFEPPIEAAKGRGVSAELVIAIVDHAIAHPGAWGPGAVRRRVLAALPGQSPAEGWIEPAEAYTKAKRAAACPKPVVVAEDPVAVHERWIREQVKKGRPTELPAALANGRRRFVPQDACTG